MTKHCVVIATDTQGGDCYLTPRRSTGYQYVDRTDWSPDLEDAKVFNNPSAAKRSARHNGEFSDVEFRIVPVTLVLETEND